MANAITISILDSSGAYRPTYLMQDETTPTTIHGVFGGSAHDLTGCTASADGTWVFGSTKVFFADVSVNIAIAPSRVSIAASIIGDVGGAISAVDSAALVGFVKAAKLPPIAAA